MARKRLAWLAFGGVAVFAASIWGGYELMPRSASTDTANLMASLSTTAEPPPDKRVAPAPDEPANFYATRSGAGWTHVQDVTPERLPAPSGEPMDPRDGAADCAPPGRASRAAGGRDARETTVSVNVQPRSFQDITITALRVRILSATPVSGPPRYIYSCEHSENAVGSQADLYVFADRGEVHEATQVEGESLPTDVPAQIGSGWTAGVSVVALGKRYTWRIEIDYTAKGKAYTKLLTADSDGIPFVTEAAQRAVDFDGSFLWCARAFPPAFRPKQAC
jgi:hypothetical protein